MNKSSYSWLTNVISRRPILLLLSSIKFITDGPTRYIWVETRYGLVTFPFAQTLKTSHKASLLWLVPFSRGGRFVRMTWISVGLRLACSSGRTSRLSRRTNFRRLRHLKIYSSCFHIRRLPGGLHSHNGIWHDLSYVCRKTEAYSMT